MRIAARIFALLPLAVLAFAVNAYASFYFAAYLFPMVQPRPYGEMISAAVVGAVAAGAVVSYPLVKQFPQRYWLAALAVAVPILELRGHDFHYYVGTSETRIVVMSVVEFLVYPTALLACAWLVSQWLESGTKGTKHPIE